MSTVATTQDNRLAGIGTVAFHAAIIAMLFLVKCQGTGGGGGNEGLGYTGFMSMDVAGIGNSVDGWGPTEDAPKPETQPVVRETVTQETASVTDNSATEDAPVINQNKNTKPKTETTKPSTTPKPETKPDPQPSKGLTDAFGKLGGSGNTTGSGKQGTEDGSIDGKGVLGGGGSTGTGGGQGGGDGTGTGPGTGPGSGPGRGGLNSDYSLTDRSLSRKPSISETAPDEGKVVVDIWVDKNGNVTKAVANAAKSNTTNSKLYALAEKAAKNAKFSSNPNAPNEQKGTITITFKLH